MLGAPEMERKFVIKGEIGKQANHVVQNESDQSGKNSDACGEQGNEPNAIAGGWFGSGCGRGSEEGELHERFLRF